MKLEFGLVNVIKFFSSSRPEVFCKDGVLKNFAKCTGKHLCQGLFFNKVADLRPSDLLKNRLRHRCFPVYFAIFLRTTNTSDGAACRVSTFDTELVILMLMFCDLYVQRVLHI